MSPLRGLYQVLLPSFYKRFASPRLKTYGFA